MMNETIDYCDFTEHFKDQMTSLAPEEIHDEIMESEINISLLKIGERTLPPWKGLPEAIREERTRIKILQSQLRFAKQM